MSDSSELRDALRVAVPVLPDDKVNERRQALLAVIEREIYATPRRLEQEQARFKWKRRARILSVAAALIATLGLGMLVSQFEGGGPWEFISQTAPVHSAGDTKGSAKRVDLRQSLAGQSFETTAGHEKVLHLGGDTRAALAAHTKVFVDRDTANEQHLSLSSGGLLLSVPPHRMDRSVQVKTAHATVQVTGTVFGVEVGRFSQPGDTPPRTRVSVERGQVVVLHAAGRAVLEPGDTWLSPLHLTHHDSKASSPRPTASQSEGRAEDTTGTPTSSDHAPSVGPSGVGPSGVGSITGTAGSANPRTANSRSGDSSAASASAASPNTAAADTRATANAALAPERARVATPTTQQQTDEPSTLAAQNNLLEKALSAEKRGNQEHAKELIDRFLQRYPRSPLRASALAIKKRLSSPD